MFRPRLDVPPQIRINSGQYYPFDESQEPYYPQHYGLRRTLTPDVPPSLTSGLSTTESTEFLLPPRPNRLRYNASFTDGTSTLALSTTSSRRSSLSSDSDSSDSDVVDAVHDVNTQTVSEKYNITPSDGLLLFPEDVEKDDAIHNPDPRDTERDCNFCNRRGIVNVGGLTILVLGLLMLFIGYPVLTFVRGVEESQYKDLTCKEDPHCLNVGKRPLLKNIRSGLIDPDTPDDVKTIQSADGKEWKLVFSDEFNTNGRTFYDGDDPYYQAMDFWYGVTQDLEWYDPDAVTTKDGVLELRFDHFKNHDLNYRSGMVQSWNKLCFTGGRLEASISLPGKGDTSGFWPGFWTMGNLGRPGYAATTEGMWPYSYHDECDAGITPNQSSTDGISQLPGMRLPACTCDGAEHPSPGKSRSAPELDVIEASVAPLNGDYNSMVGTASQSLQIAPFDLWYMPDYDFTAVYDDRITTVNPYRGGPYQQAISGLSNLNNKWYNGTEYQVYAFEYNPGAEGDVTWFIGKDKTWTLDGRAIGPNGNIGHRTIPVEPMALIMNLGMGESFAQADDGIEELMPAFMRFDYIRIYQDPDNVSVTCDPEGYETTEYIKKHAKAYQNVNVTSWFVILAFYSDIDRGFTNERGRTDAGYDWPQNSFMNKC
ncbi:Beta-glucan synthesis-associated protein [Aspergillus sclerotialis]|uniref:Beta-glucan synthesis-associated protein n=1 Tax=Aspergillus sclerotialis TaxID=2070753 RepID=A0A3A2Z4D2_9EURO|nr:Beta-glucan synthesis-associated protein [Aspergillus sclerotialis]